MQVFISRDKQEMLDGQITTSEMFSLICAFVRSCESVCLCVRVFWGGEKLTLSSAEISPPMLITAVVDRPFVLRIVSATRKTSARALPVAPLHRPSIPLISSPPPIASHLVTAK